MNAWACKNTWRAPRMWVMMYVHVLCAVCHDVVMLQDGSPTKGQRISCMGDEWWTSMWVDDTYGSWSKRAYLHMYMYISLYTHTQRERDTHRHTHTHTHIIFACCLFWIWQEPATHSMRARASRLAAAAKMIPNAITISTWKPVFYIYIYIYIYIERERERGREREREMMMMMPNAITIST